MAEIEYNSPELTTRDFEKVRALIHQRAGIDLHAGKEGLVKARLGRKLRDSGSHSYAEYLASVESDRTGESLIALIDALTTNYTYFFREPEHFNFLRDKILPKLAERPSVDLWCAAAATGEEPYTLAMLLLETCGLSSRVVATDISTQAVKQAKRGVYPVDRFESVPKTMLHKYWLRGDGKAAGYYKAKPELASAIDYRHLNLIAPFSFPSPFPVIFCRNVMIYFDRATQRRVVDRMSQFLEPGGYLFVGHSESQCATHPMLEFAGPAVYRKRKGAGKE